MKLYCLGDPHTVIGFALAGVAGRVATCAADAERALAELAALPDCAVLVVTDELAASIPDAVRRLRLSKGPLVLAIPGPQGPTGGSRALAALAQQAVGIRLDEAGG